MYNVTVTKEVRSRCGWCGAVFIASPGSGRPRKYCKRSHRQRDYEARLEAERRDLGDDELLIERAKLDELRDRLYVLEAACEDVETDLEEDETLNGYRRAVADLLKAARPLLRVRIEPKADPRG